MKSARLPLLSLLLFCAEPASAKYWTDVQGRVLEGEMVRLSNGDPVVHLASGDTKIPLAKLCEEDQRFVESWKLAHVMDSTNTSLFLDGKLLEAEAKPNIVEKGYPPKTLKSMAEAGHPEETGFKIGIALPPIFDPAKPQRIFVISTGVNNEQERLSGNLGKFKMYAKLCVENGWACLAIDSNNGYPSTFAAIEDAIAYLSKTWPRFVTNEYAVGGYSGGAKACFANAAWLIRNKYKVTGAFVGGANQDFSKLYRDALQAPVEPYKNLKAFVSAGKKDTTATPEQTAEVVKSLGANGIENVRTEWQDGGHSFHQPHFVSALEWFAQPLTKK